MYMKTLTYKYGSLCQYLMGNIAYPSCWAVLSLQTADAHKFPDVAAFLKPSKHLQLPGS